MRCLHLIRKQSLLWHWLGATCYRWRPTFFIEQVVNLQGTIAYLYIFFNASSIRRNTERKWLIITDSPGAQTTTTYGLIHLMKDLNADVTSLHKPKREMRPIWIRARSGAQPHAFYFPPPMTNRVISIKSITIKPPRSRKRSWRNFIAASKCCSKAVSSYATASLNDR